MLKIILQFVISGTIVVLAGYLANKVGQRWAGLLVAAPLLTLITFVFLSIDSSTRSLQEYLSSALVYMIPAAVFIGMLYLLSPRLHVVATVSVSVVAYAAIVLITNYMLKQ